ncbi:MAG: hypothetical protein R3E73_04230 [Porticoccaceae bacterium]
MLRVGHHDKERLRDSLFDIRDQQWAWEDNAAYGGCGDTGL